MCEVKKMDKQKEKLKKMLIAEREKVKGYEEIAKLHSAYITILLRRLNATEDKPVTISADDVKNAVSRYEARAFKNDLEGWSFYVEELNG